MLELEGEDKYCEGRIYYLSHSLNQPCQGPSELAAPLQLQGDRNQERVLFRRPQEGGCDQGRVSV